MAAEHILTEEDVNTRRLRSCVDNWPDAESGEYNPYCCRFPKSCSPHGYIEAAQAGNLREEHLEPKKNPPPPPVPKSEVAQLADLLIKPEWSAMDEIRATELVGQLNAEVAKRSR